MDCFLAACGWTVYTGFLLGTSGWFVASFEAVRVVGWTVPALWNLFVCFLVLYSCLMLLFLKLSCSCGSQRGVRPLAFSLFIVLGPVVLGLTLLGLAIDATHYKPVCGAFFENPALAGTILTTTLLMISSLASVGLVCYWYFGWVWGPHLVELQANLQPLVYLRTVEKSDGTCSICLEPHSQEIGRLRRCGHAFHQQCIENWVAYSPRCPVCRVVV